MAKILQTLIAASVFFLQLTPAHAQTGSISGVVVTNSAENITSGQIMVLKVSNPTILFTQTSISNGAYTISNLADDAYYVFTLNASTASANYLDTLYNGVRCTVGQCNFLLGTPVTVSGGAAITGINFQLAEGGKISGRVSNVTDTLSGVTTIALLNSDKQAVATLQRDSSSNFEFAGVRSGTYYLFATNSAGYTSQVYQNISCNGQLCFNVPGTPVVVTEGQTTSNINFNLSLGGTISGVVSDFTTKIGLPVGTAYLYGTTGLITVTNLNSDGSYSFSGLTNGNYFIVANAPDHTPELYDKIHCPYGVCAVLSGKPVALTVGQNSAANFALRAESVSNYPELTGAFSGIPVTNRLKKSTFTVKNSGKLGANNFTVKLYRSSSNKIVSGKSKVFKTQVIKVLAAGKESKFTFTLKKDSKNPFVIADIDTTFAVTEKSKKNNKIAKKL